MTPDQKEIVDEIFNDLKEYAKFMKLEPIKLKSSIIGQLEIAKAEFVLKFDFITDSSDEKNKNKRDSYSKNEMIEVIKKSIDSRAESLDADKTINFGFSASISLFVIFCWLPLRNLKQLSSIDFATITLSLATIYLGEKIFNQVFAVWLKNSIFGLKKCSSFLEEKYLR